LYRCRVTDEPTVTVNAAPTLTLSVSDATICNPASGNVTITVTSAQSGYLYELRTSAGASLSPAVSATGTGANLDLTLLQANAPTATTTYKVYASINGCTAVALTDEPTVTVNAAPTLTLSVSDATICNPANGNVTITVTSAQSGYLYELRTSAGASLSPAVSASGTSANLDLTILQANAPTATTTYKVYASINGCTAVALTDEPTVTVNAAPTLTLAVSDATICNPASGNVTLTVTSAQSGYLYELRTSAGASLSPAVSATGTGANLDLTILQANAPTTTTTYKVYASINGCTAVALTDEPTVTVNAAPTLTLAASDATICNPSSGNVTITVTSAQSGYLYELRTSAGASLSPAVSATGTGANLDLTILQANAPTATTTYKVFASINGCTAVALTDEPTVTVNAAPTLTLAVSDATICNPATGDVTITVTSAQSGYLYELRNSAGAALSPTVSCYRRRRKFRFDDTASQRTDSDYYL
jgi:hypothetical protein